jgi:hypothetical protein
MSNREALELFGGVVMAAAATIVPLLIAFTAIDAKRESEHVTIIPKVHVSYDRCPAMVTWPNNNPAFVPECFEV